MFSRDNLFPLGNFYFILSECPSFVKRNDELISSEVKGSFSCYAKTRGHEHG